MNTSTWTRIRMAGLLAMLAAVLASVPVRAEVLDRVLAVVDDQLITLTDVTAARDFGFVVVPPNAPDPIRAALTQLIDRELMLAEVERYAPPEPSVEAVSEGLRVVRSRFADDASYQAALARSGIDESRLRDIVRQNLRISAYLTQRFVLAPGTNPAALPPAGGQRTLVDDWLAGLRRRAAIIDLYLSAR